MYTGIEDKIFKDVANCLDGDKLIALGLSKEDWEELCIDFLVEEINSGDVRLLVLGGCITSTTWEKIRTRIVSKALRILDDAYSTDLKRWGYEEILEED